MEVVASKAANLPYAELEASPVSPPNWAGPASALVLVTVCGIPNSAELGVRIQNSAELSVLGVIL